MKIDLAQKRVLVTGGTSGIGAAMVRAFAAAGARVAINYRQRADDAAALAVELQQTGAEALALEADVSDEAAVAALFRRLDEVWGGLDVLVNNAGIEGARQAAWETEPQAWRRVLEVNLTGAFLCAREALARMVPQQAGVILNTSSVHEIIAWGGHAAYASSKAALGMLAKTLAQEAAPFGIRVISLAPGAIRTPINESVWRDPEGLQDLHRKIPLGRIGEPQEVADIAVVLASDVASYITGTTIFVDGGMSDYPDFMHGG